MEKDKTKYKAFKDEKMQLEPKSFPLPLNNDDNMKFQSEEKKIELIEKLISIKTKMDEEMTKIEVQKTMQLTNPQKVYTDEEIENNQRKIEKRKKIEKLKKHKEIKELKANKNKVKPSNLGFNISNIFPSISIVKTLLSSPVISL